MTEHHHWTYCDDDDCGPAHWIGDIHGKNQSPIDIDLAHLKRDDNMHAIVFSNYQHILPAEIINNGHSVQIIPEKTAHLPEIHGGGLDQHYRLIQYHFHWGQQDHEGSEHTLAGLQFPAELHLVHQGVENPSKLAVLGVFLKLNKEGKAFQEEAYVMTKLVEPNSKAKIEKLHLKDKLPHNTKSFFRYQGSLTTPPCSECVTWTIFTEPVSITKEQLNLFRQVKDTSCKVLQKNYRPVQQLHHREVHHCIAK